MAYDKVTKLFNKCCKKKVAKKENIQLSKDEMEKIKEKEIKKDNTEDKEEVIKKNSFQLLLQMNEVPLQLHQLSMEYLNLPLICTILE